MEISIIAILKKYLPKNTLGQHKVHNIAHFDKLFSVLRS